MTMSIFDIVKERPLPGMTDAQIAEPVRCPMCSSTNTHKLCVEIRTQHYFRYTDCLDCEQKFTRHEVQRAVLLHDRGRVVSGLWNVWFTRRVDGQEVVLAGMPSCMESFVYHCARCDGPVKRLHLKLDKDEPVEGGILSGRFEDGRFTPHYRTRYDCESCKHGDLVLRNYWYPGDPLQPIPEATLSTPSGEG